MTMENRHLIKTKKLGVMSLVYIIVFYDYPRIFICKNDNGSYFIFSESDIGDDFCEWAVARISYEQLLKLNSGDIDFSTVYSGQTLFLVTQKAGEELCDSVEYPSLPEEKLPDLHENHPGFIDDYHRQLVQDISNKSMKPVVSFAINDGCDSYPSAPYGEIKRLGDPISRAASSICPSLRENDIRVVLSSASTVINFELSDPSSWQGKLLKDDDVKPSEKVATTIAKMNVAKTSDELYEAAGRDAATVKAYKALMKSFSPIAKSKEISAIVAIPKSSKTTFVSFSEEKIESSLKNIDIVEEIPQPITKKEFHLSGVLVGLLSKDKKTFQFCPEGAKVDDLPDFIKGSAKDDIFKNNPGFVLNTGRYEVDITKTIDPSLKRGKTHYTLTSIKPLPALVDK